ncbi:MAG: sugar kinase [Oscillatoriales cyanobacterium C42_A2020_001]|nr:sugar kinase [Leptolyngbyaceae cyanobacterium C42_A2020_001]
MPGLFIGLTTLDLIYRAPQPPAANQKLVASDYAVAAGGPATNAAVAFAALGNEATILSAVGCHPITHLILADLQQCGVQVCDLSPAKVEPPPVSSIIVTEVTGERAVISINAVKTAVAVESIPAGVLDGVDVVLIDGHQMHVGQAIAQQAKAQTIPVVIDGGSWKDGFEHVLPLADFVICSANFHPPGCRTEPDAIAYLQTLGIPHIAITHGEKPIQVCDLGQLSTIPVPQIRAVDTLGAGDIFHGAFCHYILQTSFVQALEQAANVAARSCQQFGTRAWMQVIGDIKERKDDLLR